MQGRIVGGYVASVMRQRSSGSLMDCIVTVCCVLETCDPGPEVTAYRLQETARSANWPSLTQGPRAEHLRKLQRSIGDQRGHIGCPHPPHGETKAQEAQGPWATASGPRAGILE